MSSSKYVAGLRAVELLIASNPEKVKRIYAEYQSANPRVKAVIHEAQEKSIEVLSAHRARLQSMSGEARHQGIVAALGGSRSMDEAELRSMVEQRLTSDEAPLLLLILDSVQDPHNLGACLRSADAAGVDAVVVPKHRAAKLGPTVSKVAAGAAENIPLVTVTNLGRVLDWLDEYGVGIVGTSDAAESTLFDADLTGPVAIIMGGEHEGLAKGLINRCTDLVSLPMAGIVESLNVSVATGICLFEAVRQRHRQSGKINDL